MNGSKKISLILDADTYEKFKRGAKEIHYRSVQAQLRYMVAHQVLQDEKQTMQRRTGA